MIRICPSEPAGVDRDGEGRAVIETAGGTTGVTAGAPPKGPELDNRDRAGLVLTVNRPGDGPWAGAVEMPAAGKRMDGWALPVSARFNRMAPRADKNQD